MFGDKQGVRDVAVTLGRRTRGICVVPDYSLSQLDGIVLQNLVIIDWGIVAVLCLMSRRRGSVGLFLLFCLSIFVTVCILLHLLYRAEKRQNAHPAHVLDIAKCMKWIFRQSKWTHKPVFLLGHSAGGHLAALVVLNPRFLDISERERICGVVCISGLFSFFRMQESPLRFFINRGVFAEHAKGLDYNSYLRLDKIKKCACKEECQPLASRYERILDAWPLFQVLHSAQPYKPRFLLLSAELDLSIILHTADFAQALDSFGFSVEHLHFKKTTHFSLHRFWTERHKYVADAIVEFIKP